MAREKSCHYIKKTFSCVSEIISDMQNRDYSYRCSIRNIQMVFEYTREKNGFDTATKLGTANNFFVAATKNFAAATKSFVDRTKDFIVVTNYFCYPYFDK